MEIKYFIIKNNVAYLDLNYDVKLQKVCKEAKMLIKNDIDLYLQISKKDIVEVWNADSEIKCYLSKVNSNFKIVEVLTDEKLCEYIKKSIEFNKNKEIVVLE